LLTTMYCREEFYKIHGDTIIDFGIRIEDDLSDDSNVYEKKHKKAIKQIIKIMNNTSNHKQLY